MMQNRTYVFNKKVVARLDKKIAVYRKKKSDGPREESITEELEEEPITEDSKRGAITEDHKEDPITEKSKEGPITEKPEEKTITEDPKDDATLSLTVLKRNPSLRTLRSYRPLITFARQKNSFDFLVHGI